MLANLKSRMQIRHEHAMLNAEHMTSRLLLQTPSARGVSQQDAIVLGELVRTEREYGSIVVRDKDTAGIVAYVHSWDGENRNRQLGEVAIYSHLDAIAEAMRYQDVLEITDDNGYTLRDSAGRRLVELEKGYKNVTRLTSTWTPLGGFGMFSYGVFLSHNVIVSDVLSAVGSVIIVGSIGIYNYAYVKLIDVRNVKERFERLNNIWRLFEFLSGQKVGEKAVAIE
jgi:hypothetical protein